MSSITCREHCPVNDETMVRSANTSIQRATQNQRDKKWYGNGEALGHLDCLALVIVLALLPSGALLVNWCRHGKTVWRFFVKLKRD